MGVCGRFSIVILGLLLTRAASAADPGMVEVPTPAPSTPAAAQVVTSADRGPRFSLSVASRGVCFGIGELGCSGGEQFGFGMKYGEVHAGVMFGAGGFRETYLEVAPFVGGEVGTRYYTLARRRSFEFSMAGRATLDLFLSVPPQGPDNKVLVFVNTVGPNLRWMFGDRFGLFFRLGIGWDVGGTVNSPDAKTGVSLAGDAQLGMTVRL